MFENVKDYLELMVDEVKGLKWAEIKVLSIGIDIKVNKIVKTFYNFTKL